MAVSMKIGDTKKLTVDPQCHNYFLETSASTKTPNWLHGNAYETTDQPVVRRMTRQLDSQKPNELLKARRYNILTHLGLQIQHPAMHHGLYQESNLWIDPPS